ncbi:HAD family hydrolase [Wolbachia endosymbiont (group A) of Icerya purchasi]|uniref:hypothetical protein n=1 Tax=Wolbachia endosymbiont (group A) of Icerya purchasi TaxID=2954019 RepID=UPI002230F281|nr:hypothetical protein [Wolbachia endosymbiont (group A) of Icerya purchasi]
MPGSVNENNFTPIPIPRTSTLKKNDEEINPPSSKEAEKTISSAMLDMAGNNTLLIFDFDQTITNQSMHNFFVSKNYSDYNSGEKNAVTKEKIEEFLQNPGIKNKEKLRPVLKSALSSGVEVAIVSSAKYIKAVEYVVKNHLGLTEEQAQGIKVVGGTTKRQDPLTEVAKRMNEPQDPQIEKHLCVLYLLKAYKKDKGMLPQKVMLIDGNQRNIDPDDDFRRNVEELLEKDMGSFLENIDQKIVEVDISEEELKNITFKGINVSSEQTTETDRATDDGYLGKVEKWIKEPTHQNLQDIKSPGTFPTSPPSYKSKDDSEESLSLNSDIGSTTNKKTNRFLPRAKYAMQQKGFIIFGASAIILSISAALLYLQDKAKFIAFFTNSPKYITIPVIALAALLAIGPIFFATRQFIDTEEHSIQKKDADKILAEVLEHQPKDKAIKSVRLEYSNGTHSNFVLNAWEAKQGFTNIDEKVITRTNKIKSVINDRPIFTALFTGVVAANIALPLWLYAEGGVNNVQKFYQNPLTNNIGLLLLIGSGILALSIICLGVHYYRKTNCTNLIYSEGEIDPKDVNGKFIEEIKRERTNVLGENHSKDAKRSSLTLEQVVVQSHNCKDIVYSVG